VIEEAMNATKLVMAFPAAMKPGGHCAAVFAILQYVGDEGFLDEQAKFAPLANEKKKEFPQTTKLFGPAE
jgi:hypothetical protein